MDTLHGKALVTWIDAVEGGRVSGPPTGEAYQCTVVPSGQAKADHFSVEMAIAIPGAPETLVGLQFFAIDLAAAWLAVGAEFHVMEGPKRVGNGRVTEVGHTIEQKV